MNLSSKPSPDDHQFRSDSLGFSDRNEDGGVLFAAGRLALAVVDVGTAGRLLDDGRTGGGKLGLLHFGRRLRLRDPQTALQRQPVPGKTQKPIAKFIIRRQTPSKSQVKASRSQ